MGTDRIITADKPLVEVAHWHPKWMIERFEDSKSFKAFLAECRKQREKFRVALYDTLGAVIDHETAQKFAYGVVEFAGNNLENAGINQLWTLVCGTGATKWDHDNGYLGVGDSTDEFDAADTDLQAAVNKLRKAMDTSYPTYGTSQKITARSSFGGDDANYAWDEFGFFNHASAGTILNRKVSAQGTKTAGQTWVLSLENSLS